MFKVKVQRHPREDFLFIDLPDQVRNLLKLEEDDTLVIETVMVYPDQIIVYKEVKDK